MPIHDPDRDEVFEFEIEQISKEALTFSHDLPPGGGFRKGYPGTNPGCGNPP
jgi:hypothetical protein